MHDCMDGTAADCGLKSFTHPRYFYGQRLDVSHFESEQDYFKSKMRLMNRLVVGCGVVCGLDVEVGPDRHSVVVTPGYALDKCGREIVVPCRSKSVPIASLPALPPQDTKQPGQYNKPAEGDDEWVSLAICYKETKGGPEPVLAAGCDATERCSPGSIREGYEIPPPRQGKARPVHIECQIPDLVKGNRINYAALASWVTRPCDMPDDCCIPLANIHRPRGDNDLNAADIDISVRPVVYSLDLLFELMLALTSDGPTRRCAK